MIRFFLILLLVMLLVSASAIFAAIMQSKKKKAAEKQYYALYAAFQQVKERTGRLQKALGETAKVEEAANAEQNELAKTPDSGLADRANKLFKQL